MAPIDPSTDLLAFLKPHPRSSSEASRTQTAASADAGPAVPPSQMPATAPQDRPTRWDDVLEGAEPALRNAWRVNILNLSFRGVTAVTAAAIAASVRVRSGSAAARSRRTRETDAVEFAIVILLTVMLSPLSFNYAYVWLIYPLTLALNLVMSEPPDAPGHRWKVAWITAVFLLPALALPMPVLAQAYGNLFLPSLFLLFGLGVMLRAAGRATPKESTALKTHSFTTSPSFAVNVGGHLEDMKLCLSRRDWYSLPLPFFELWPRMPRPFKRGIQREGTQSMQGGESRWRLVR